MPYLTPVRETGPTPVRPPRPIIPLGRFLAPVREAGGGGTNAPHWATFHAASGAEGESDQDKSIHAHIEASGHITRGPASLIGHHVGAVASHSSIARTQHHPPGFEPPGARDHPAFAEHDVMHGQAGPPKPSQPHVGGAIQTAQTEAKTAADPTAKLAAAAVAHEQAKTALARHRASKDKYANPYAPHLSPAVGDEKDAELAKAAIQAEIALQAVMDAIEGQKAGAERQATQAHEKDMAHMKIAAQAPRAHEPLYKKPAAR